MTSNLPPALLRQSVTVLADIAGKARVWARALPAIEWYLAATRVALWSH